ncbi:MAG: response regulator transcription factor [Pseudomonadota bacterium]|nr:response regulator transcription factor [Pseudomonadota bacterium]MEC8580780.1 response regulator transcription factor [Pseudomonadota bacterium]
MINIVLISSNSFFIDALRLTMPADEFSVTSVLRTPQQLETPNAFATGRCDLVIWDQGTFPDIGKTVIAALRRRRVQLGILAVLPSYDPTQMASCYDVGCDGVLMSDLALEKLPHHLRLLASGHKVFPDQVADIVLQMLTVKEPRRTARAANCNFSLRQKKVLGMILDGAQNKGIAQALKVPLTTVKADIKTMMRETGAQNRTDLAISVLRTGLIDPSELEGAAPFATTPPEQIKL